MGRKSLSDLNGIFVSFEAHQTDGMSIAFFNAGLRCELNRQDVLQNYAYLVSGVDTCPKESGRVKTFYAERYGGGGIVRNGGGGRCGFDGRYHLKGIGPNQLVGKDADAGHGNGCLCLGTAVYESVWSEIINLALPYGAIRTVAVLDTGLQFEQFGQQLARGLLVREPVVRPAHFIRAVYFKEPSHGGLGKDAQRVRLAVQQLGEFLPEAVGARGDESPDVRFADGMVELARRYACQFAVARAKRITHLNVSASNLSIDGAWLDLSGTRIVSGLIAGDRHEINGVLQEYRGRWKASVTCVTTRPSTLPSVTLSHWLYRRVQKLRFTLSMSVNFSTLPPCKRDSLSVCSFMWLTTRFIWAFAVACRRCLSVMTIRCRRSLPRRAGKALSIRRVRCTSRC